MANKIKCSYEECFKHFPSQEAMRKHKIKEPSHEYCKRCDVDCEDNMEYLIHQMMSKRHIACCICGEEFRSEGGRDIHVEHVHPKQQDLPCPGAPGCKEIFPRAASLMFHIEQNQCKFVTSDHFAEQRAQRQILKDAWLESLDAKSINNTMGTVKSGVGSDADSQPGGVSLLDGHLPSTSNGWQGVAEQAHVAQPLQSVTNRPYTTPRPIFQSMGGLSPNNFPALPVEPVQKMRKASGQAKRESLSEDNGDLLSFDNEAEKNDSILDTRPIVWSGKGTASSTLFPKNSSDINDHNGSDLNPGSAPPSMFAHLSQISGQEGSAIPAAAKPENKDPNASYASVRTKASSNQPATTLDVSKFWDSILGKYVCPGRMCGRKFASPDDFIAHLNTGAHVGGRTTCPSCLNKFNSTHALIAHCESASRRCTIRKTANYNQVMRELTADLIGTDGHLIDGTVRYVTNDLKNWVEGNFKGGNGRDTATEFDSESRQW